MESYLSSGGREPDWEDEDEGDDDEAEASGDAGYGKNGRRVGRTRSRGSKGHARIAASSAYKQRFSEALKAELVSNAAAEGNKGQGEKLVFKVWGE